MPEMRNIVGYVVAGLVATAFSGASARADEQRPVLELANKSEFSERFAGNAQVSGQFLSGLAYQSDAGQLDLKQVRLSYTRPSAEIPASVCVRVTSDDGRYWASNMYRSTGTFHAAPAVPIPTQYGEQLQAYRPSGLLMLATFSESCNETVGKTYVPGLLGEKSGDRLVAYVNVSQSKVSASLTDGQDTVLEQVTCRKPADGAKVTFSHLCNVSLAKLTYKGRYTLIVGVRGLTGKPAEQKYAVHIE